jgi:hypothetical protein
MLAYSWARLAFAPPAFALALGLAGSRTSRFPLGRYDSDAYTLNFDSTGGFLYLKGDPRTYRWQMVGSALWFHSLRDPCQDRIRGLADQAWRPHRAR